MFDSLVSVWSLIDFAFPNTVLQEFHNNWILIGLLHRPENFPLHETRHCPSRDRYVSDQHVNRKPRHERKHQYCPPWPELGAGTLRTASCPCEPTLLSFNCFLLIPGEKKYHEWMEDPELRMLTASERLTLQEEYNMQRRRISRVWLGDLMFLFRDLAKR